MGPSPYLGLLVKVPLLLAIWPRFSIAFKNCFHSTFERRTVMHSTTWNSYLKYWCIFNYFPFINAAELDLCFILNATGKEAKEDFAKIKECIKVLIRKIGVSSTNYCIISFKKGKAFQHVAFNKKVTYKNDEGGVVFQNDASQLIRKLDSLNVSGNCTPALHDDFEQALNAFKHDATRNSSKKVTNKQTYSLTLSHF